MNSARPFSAESRATIQSLRASRIREVANAGMGRTDVLPFWFGEPDEVTPEFIREAAKQSLDAGETFYTQNFGLPALRETIAAYSSRLHRPTQASTIALTSSGVSGLMLTAQLLLNPGDRVVIVTPLWPNLVEIPKILNAEVVTVSLQLNTKPTHPVWELDLDELLDALTPDTKALLLNSPNNPTGWIISREQQAIVLAHCRKHGIWLIADDVYERLIYDQPGSAPACAPSFLNLTEVDERVISINSFSKSWLMTGWRLGWIQAPESLIADLGKLIEYNTSCAPGFVQTAGIVAIERGEEIISRTIARYTLARNYLYEQLSQPFFREAGVIAPFPQGAMYLFFKINGETDTLALCKQLVAEAGIGLAPGSAFGPEGEGAIRWCFASSLDKLEIGVQRLENFLKQRVR
ncbi:MAG: pyridoxal phosphate-dependent aminotransferase [Oxalobacteraceae bacterium]|jgi:aspartate/methionine/tyrosine aminotransferase|nr:pyridoxal phosphate-dependent aminotransferase [Oxalobacteraceae bacterium]